VEISGSCTWCDILENVEGEKGRKDKQKPIEKQRRRLVFVFVVSSNPDHHHQHRHLLPLAPSYPFQGRDKHENESLIAYGLPHDIWFHVEDMSSAHVYLRPPASLFPPVVASSKPHKTKSAAPASDDGASSSGREGEGNQQQQRAWHDIPPSVLSDLCQLVKHNSISGSKASTVDVVYTPWSNLKKTDRMDVGQVRVVSLILS